MNMKKRILSLILAAALCLALTACGSTEASAVEETEAPAEMTAEATEETAEAGTSAEADAGRLIGIVAAMESEITAIKDAEDTEEIETVAGMEFCVGTIGTCRVVVVECGMGKVNAAVATELLIERFGADAIINIGCAGSLNDTLDIGDFVVSTEVVQHDYDVSAVGYEKGEIPYTGLVSFPADEELITLACEAIAAAAPERQVVKGRICTGDQFISESEQKSTIIDSFGGECAEMEGAAVGQTAYLNGIPFVIIRAMSDNADSAADFTEYVDEVTREGAEVVIHMVESMQ